MPETPPRTPNDIRDWLNTQPPLSDMQTAFPQEWSIVERDLAEIVPRGDRNALTNYVAALARSPQTTRKGISSEIRRHMAVAAIKQLSVQAATGVTSGSIRFNLINGTIMQKLLFEGGGFTRKPVSMRAFKLAWPLLRQRRLLMPLVAKKGIFCFYSRALVDRLAEMIGDRRALEIAAGDGTLTRFLRDAGVQITATDDHSWRDIDFPSFVIREDARRSLKTRNPEVVLCSWPPAENTFERAVFSTRSVQLYVVISSRHRFASGDWAAYGRQHAFAFHEAHELSQLVLPPELDAAVYVFTRVRGEAA